MRLSEETKRSIREIAHQLFGQGVRVRVFGSRLDDDRRGGDLDLLIESSEVVREPALSSSRLAARVSRVMYGRKVDVLVCAPNLRRLPIHDLAIRKGELL